MVTPREGSHGLWSIAVGRRTKGTTVLASDPSRFTLYKRTYDPYFGSDTLRFPVEPLPPTGDWPLKTPVAAVRTASDWHVYALHEIAGLADDSGAWTTAVDGVDVRFAYRAEPPAAWPQAGGPEQVDIVYAFWFAWYATRPEGVAAVP